MKPTVNNNGNSFVFSRWWSQGSFYSMTFGETVRSSSFSLLLVIMSGLYCWPLILAWQRSERERESTPWVTYLNGRHQCNLSPGPILINPLFAEDDVRPNILLDATMFPSLASLSPDSPQSNELIFPNNFIFPSYPYKSYLYFRSCIICLNNEFAQHKCDGVCRFDVWPHWTDLTEFLHKNGLYIKNLLPFKIYRFNGCILYDVTTIIKVFIVNSIIK